jgi:hypothetical protein
MANGPKPPGIKPAPPPEPSDAPVDDPEDGPEAGITEEEKRHIQREHVRAVQQKADEPILQLLTQTLRHSHRRLMKARQTGAACLSAIAAQERWRGNGLQYYDFHDYLNQVLGISVEFAQELYGVKLDYRLSPEELETRARLLRHEKAE